MIKTVGVLLLLALLHTSLAQDADGRFIHNLTFSIIPLIAFVIIVIMAVIGIYFIYKARRGSFGCCDPKMRYRCHDVSIEKGGNLPEYKGSLHNNEAPPAYQDAFQDKLVNEIDATDSTPLHP